MSKSATDLMQEIMISAFLDSIDALKASSKGLPNNMLRELAAIHANTTFADLPKEVQTAISASVRSAFTRLLKHGYSVSTGQPAPPRPAPYRREGAAPPRGTRPPSARRDGPENRQPPRGGRPPRRPKPGGS